MPGKTVSISVSSTQRWRTISSCAWVLIGCKRTVRVLFCWSGTRSTSVRKSCRISERASSRRLSFSRASWARAVSAPAVWTSPDAQHRLIFDILSGRGGLNHGWVTKDVGWRSLAERFGLNLLTQECYRVLAGGTPSGIAPLG